MNTVLCIGAHPDDIEGSIGGTAALLARRGDAVHIVSVTDGHRGHFAHEYAAHPERLVARRMEEARLGAACIGAEFHCMGFPDGEVYVTAAATEQMVRLIRNTGPMGRGPDLVLLNRLNDYHRDHRAAAQLVLDSAYMLTVPFYCSDTPHLQRMPVFAYWYDEFTEGGRFTPQVVVPIDGSIETRIDMAVCHASQYFEWLPYNRGALESVPGEPAARRDYIAEGYRKSAEDVRAGCSALLDLYGESACRYAEAFQISEYGTTPSATELLALFPDGSISVGGQGADCSVSRW